MSLDDQLRAFVREECERYLGEVQALEPLRVAPGALEIFERMHPDTLLAPADVARWTRTSEKTLANWRSTRPDLLPYSKAGSRVVYRVGDVRAWLKRSRKDGRSA